MLLDPPAAGVVGEVVDHLRRSAGRCRRRCSAPPTRRRRRSRRCRPGRRRSGRRGTGGASRPASRRRRRRSCRPPSSVGWKVPLPLFSDTHTPASPKPDDVGPAVAGQVGEEAGVLLDPPAAGVVGEVVDHLLSVAWKVPLPLFSATHTPASPNPTMSARPSPVRSARKRGCFSTRQPPALVGEVVDHLRRSAGRCRCRCSAPPTPRRRRSRRCRPGRRRSGRRGTAGASRPASRRRRRRSCRPPSSVAWNVPLPLFNDTHTPASPNPTMSARLSPVRSALEAERGDRRIVRR